MIKEEICKQPFAPPTSTETQQVPDNSLKETEYDNVKYEEQLYYHNHVTRKDVYTQPIDDGEGFNKSWDISAEIIILFDYLEKFPDYSKELSLFEKIKKLSLDVSRNITKTSRNLSTPMLPPDKRKYFASKDHTHFYPELQEENSE